MAELSTQLKSALGDPKRPIVAHSTRLVDTAGEEILTRHVVLAKRLLRTAHAGVHLIDDACVLFKRGVAVPAPIPRSIPLGELYCSYTVTSGAPLLVNDSRADPRFEHHSAVHDVDLIAYAGVPILTRDGHVLGTFCVTDNKPREWNEEDLEALRELAAAVATEIDLLFAYAAASHDAELSKAREDALTLALDATAAGAWTWDVTSNIANGDALYLAMYGFEQNEPVSFDAWIARVHPNDRARLQQQIEKLLQRGAINAWHAQFRALLPLSGERWMEVFGRVERDAVGRALRLSAINLDITERKRRERNTTFLANVQEDFARLSSVDELLRAVSTRLAEELGIARCVFVEVDAAQEKAEVFFDYSSGGLPSLMGVYHLADFLSEEARRQLTAGKAVAVEDVRRDPRSVANASNFEVLGIRALVTAPYVIDNAWRFALSVQKLSPYCWSVDEIQMFNELSARIYLRLERARADQGRTASVQRYRALVNAATQIFWVIGVTGEVEEASPSWHAFTGQSFESLRGTRDWVQAIHCDDHARLSAGWPATLATQGPYHADFRLRRHDGVYRHMEARGAPVLAADGSVREWVGMCIDVTDRKRDEEQLRHNHQTFFSLVRNAPFGVYVVDADFRLSQLSAGSRKVFSNVQPLIGRDFAEVLRIVWPEPFASEAIARFRHTLATGEPYRAAETIEQRGDVDEVESYDWKIERITLPDGRLGVVCYFYDMTERDRAEAAIRASEQRFSAAFRANSVPLSILTIEGRYLEVNDAMLAHSGYRREQVIGRNTADLMIFLDADERAAYYRNIEEHNRVRGFSARLRMANGEVRDCVLSAERIELNGENCILAARVDVTEQKRAEQRLHEYAQALQQADRHKDEFLAMLAHELRNPLAPLRSAAEVLIKLSAEREPARRAAEVVTRQAAHMARLVDDLLDVSRVTQGKIKLVMEVVNLAGAVHAGVEVARSLVDAKAQRLNVVLPHEPLCVRGDAARLTQVVGNLLTNAAKFTDPGGEIALILAREGDSAILRVRDNGVGIGADLLPHIFELFIQADRSLDRAQGGLGIGLALVKSLIAVHGGSVHVASEGLGRGSEFSVRLPLTSTSAAPGTQGQPTTKGAARRVLVVDDHADSAEMLGALLELEGHQVDYAYDGEGALERAAQFRPEVCMLDIGLPGMDGYELARRLRADPTTCDAVLIALTGYGQEEDRARSKSSGLEYHLVKPVDPQSLMQLIASLPQRHFAC